MSAESAIPRNVGARAPDRVMPFDDYMTLEEAKRRRQERQLEEQRPFAPVPEEPRREPRLLDFLTFDAFQLLPDPEPFIPGLLFRRTYAVLFGSSNTFKSFLLADVGMSIAAGRDWCGVPVPKGRVCFVVSEGALGFGKLRLPAWLDHHETPAEVRSNILIYRGSVKLDDPDAVSDLLHTIDSFGGVDFLGLDIFASMYAGDENTVETAGKVVEGLERIVAAGITVLAVAHTGFDESSQKRARGSSHMWGSWNTRLKVEGDKGAGTVTLTVERHKDAPSGQKWDFRMVETGDSMVPELIGEGFKVPAVKRLSRGGRFALDVLADLAAAVTQPTTYPDFAAPVRAVSLSAWRTACYSRGITPSDELKTREKAFLRAYSDLLAAHRIVIRDDHAWIVS